MLSVPYHAKDNPATRAEFSLPDAAIVLTCLTYYNGGLSDQQIHASFEALSQSDCAAQEYERWVKDAPDIPHAFREITGVNLGNAEQCRDVFGPLRRAKDTVDFYMAKIVFPKEMKEFPNKLSSSGWDIAREKVHPTTGFSGTNDSRYILPLSIAQRDLRRSASWNRKQLCRDAMGVEDLSFLVHLVAGVEIHVNLSRECIERELTLRMELFLSLLAALGVSDISSRDWVGTIQLG